MGPEITVYSPFLNYRMWSEKKKKKKRKKKRKRKKEKKRKKKKKKRKKKEKKKRKKKEKEEEKKEKTFITCLKAKKCLLIWIVTYDMSANSTFSKFVILYLNIF